MCIFVDKPARLIVRLLFGFDKLNQSTNSETARVGKCHGYGGYIRVKKLEGWGKKFGRTFSLAKPGNVLGKFEQLI